MTYEKLEAAHKGAIDSAVGVLYNEQVLSDKRSEGLLKIMQNYESSWELRDLNKFLKNRLAIVHERESIFHSSKGLSQHFAIKRQSIDDAVPPGGRGQRASVKNVESVIALINSTSISAIQPSSYALENQEKYMAMLKDAKENEAPLAGADKPFLPEELPAVDKLIEVLSKGAEVEYVPRKSEFKAISKIHNSLSQVDILSNKQREDYYRYWGTIDEKFDNIRRYFADVAEYYQTMENNPSLKEHLLRNDIEVRDIRVILDDVKIPNYIIQMPPVKQKEETDIFKVKRLLYDFYKMMKVSVPATLKEFTAEQEISGAAETTVRVEGEFSEEGNLIGQTASYDPTVVDEVVEEYGELAEKIQKEMKEVDPLFAIVSHEVGLKQSYSDAVISEAKEEIKKAFMYDQEDEFFEEIEDSINVLTEEFLDKFSQSQSLGHTLPFYMPILDNDDSINRINRALSYQEVEVEWTDRNGEIHSKRMKYNKAVEFINGETTNFFEQMRKLVKLSHGTAPLITKPVKVKGRSATKEGSGQYFAGGHTIPLPTKIGEAEQQMLDTFKQLTDLLNEYFIKPLQGNYVLLNDRPLFFTEPAFMDFPRLLTGGRVQKAVNSILKGATPVLAEADFKNVIKWLQALEETNDMYYDDGMIRIFDGALESLINFWQGVAQDEEDEKPLQTLVHEYTVILGDALYEIALDTYKNPEKVAKEKWMRKSLEDWHNEQESNNYTMDSLVQLLTHPTFQNYITSTESQAAKLDKKTQDLINILSKSTVIKMSPITKAMLEATDLIRKMNGDKIYYSNLQIDDVTHLEYIIDIIKKENKVDLYAVDVDQIVKSDNSFNTLSETYGLSKDIIYKIKGMFR